MSPPSLLQFNGPITAVALNEWLQRCVLALTTYMDDFETSAAKRDAYMISHTGTKISKDPPTHDLADWFVDDGSDMQSWDAFREALMVQALGPDWLIQAVADLYGTKQNGRSADEYLRDLNERYSVLKHSAAAKNPATAKQLPLDEGTFKYLMLFNTDKKVVDEVLDGDHDILAADRTRLAQWIKKASSKVIGQPSFSKPKDTAPDDETKPTPRQSLARAKWALREFYEVGDVIKGAAFSPDNSKIAAITYRRIWLFETATAQKINVYDLTTDLVSVQFLDEDQLVLSTGDTIAIWKWRSTSFDQAAKVKPPGAASLHLAISPNKQFIAAGGDGMFYVYTCPTLVEHSRFSVQGYPIPAWAPDSNLIAMKSGRDNTSITIYDVAQKSFFYTLKVPLTGIVIFTPDGANVAYITWRSDIIIDNYKRQESRILVQGSDISWVTYSPDGAVMACTGGSDTSGGIRDAATGAELAALQGTSFGNARVSFSSDGRRVLARKRGTRIVIWEASWEATP
ncbi:hypothetical protein BJY04DRAFT_200463 [Aspergillus karnatakaensis]|uniref:WD40 repeat domain-containing protein n=1 Tax=Aspergillus karnatakaensis TaxID=1810916 RepID=UPI003CCE1E3F